MYAVGVGSGADNAELEEIASRPEYVFTSSSFRDLQNISLGLTRRLCKGKDLQLVMCIGLYFFIINLFFFFRFTTVPTPTPKETPTPTIKETTPAPTTPGISIYFALHVPCLHHG